jgi:hypothetical protein
MREERKVYKVLVGKPEGRIQVGRQRRRWNNGIKWLLWRLAGGMKCGSSWFRTGVGGEVL